MDLCTKFQVSSVILTSFKQKGGVISVQLSTLPLQKGPFIIPPRLKLKQLSQSFIFLARVSYYYEIVNESLRFLLQ